MIKVFVIFVNLVSLSRSGYEEIRYHGFSSTDYYHHYESGRGNRFAHEMPGRREIGPAAGVVAINCNELEEINVNDASFGDVWISDTGKWMTGDCHDAQTKETVLYKCQGKQHCVVDTSTDFELYNIRGCHKVVPKLLISYECKKNWSKMIAPLYHMKTDSFSSGINPSFLIIRDHTSGCGKKLFPMSTAATLQEAEIACKNNQECDFFLWDQSTYHLSLCKGDNWAYGHESSNQVMGVGHSQFIIPNYAVYLNYLGICDTEDIANRYSQALDISTVASSCSSNKMCKFAVFNLSKKLRSLPGYENYAWECTNVSALVPADGMIFIAKAQPTSALMTKTASIIHEHSDSQISGAGNHAHSDL